MGGLNWKRVMEESLQPAWSYLEQTSLSDPLIYIMCSSFAGRASVDGIILKAVEAYSHEPEVKENDSSSPLSMQSGLLCQCGY